MLQRTHVLVSLVLGVILILSAASGRWAVRFTWPSTLRSAGEATPAAPKAVAKMSK